MPRQPRGAAIRFSLEKGVVLMSSYEEFMIILTIGLLIVEIVSINKKK
ncbi:MAG: hypothetical protein HUJ76_05485 [Parasporobacterium sp.]|nr:hypothetical protein [Parasporobacterium sp.]